MIVVTGVVAMRVVRHAMHVFARMTAAEMIVETFLVRRREPRPGRILRRQGKS
jgi:hypothetical protein